MRIENGKIIVEPSVKLIAKVYADGMRESALCDLFGFKNSQECSRLLKKHLSKLAFAKVSAARQRHIIRLNWLERKQKDYIHAT